MKIIHTIALSLLMTGVAGGDTITLRDGAGITGPGVTLSDVAQLNGDEARALADVQVGQFAGASETTSIRREQVKRALDQQNVNWGLMTLRGPQEIVAERRSPEHAGDVRANPVAPVTVGDGGADTGGSEDGAAVVAGRSLRELVRQWIEQASAYHGDDLRVSYEDEKDAVWALNEDAGRIELEADARNLLGRVPFTVRQYRDQELLGTYRVSVDVSVHRPVVVATRTIHRGQTIVDADVRTETRWLDSGRIRPVPDAQTLVGQMAAKVIRPDVVIEIDDAQPPAMIERGDLVTVRAISGGLVVKFVGRAVEDGSAGQTIEVQNLRSRDTYNVQVTGPREGVMTIDHSTVPAGSGDVSAGTDTKAGAS